MAKLLETKLRAAMYFSPPVISKLDKMLLELNSGKKLEQQEFNDHFTGLINAMRREIKLDGITDFHVMIMRSAAS